MHVGKSLVRNTSQTSWGSEDLTRFFVQYRHTLIAYAKRILKNDVQAEEVVQDALVRLLLAAPNLNSDDHALAYVQKTISNLAIDIFRSEGRKPNLVLIDDLKAEETVALQNRVDFSDVLAAADDAAIVRQALSLLSPAERSALILWEVEGRSAEEISRELGVKVSVVRHTVSRARTSLRKVLSNLIIDEENGLTALDLLTTNYRRTVELAKKSSRVGLAIIVLVSGYLGFSNFIDSPDLKPEVGKYIGAPSTEISTIKSPGLVLKNSEQNISRDQKAPVIKEKAAAANFNAKASQIYFFGLDKRGVPTGFTITDSQGSPGSLYFNGKEAVMNETGLTISALAKTLNGAPNVFLNQTVIQDSTGIDYVALVSFGRRGQWIPVVSKVISTDLERLVSGEYLLTATIQVKSEVDSVVVVPASAGGRDLEVAPSRVVTRILLNTSKTQILAQAVQVVEKVQKS